MITLVLTVVTDLTVAIGVGVALGLAIRLSRRDVPPATWETPEPWPAEPPKDSGDRR